MHFLPYMQVIAASEGEQAKHLGNKTECALIGLVGEMGGSVEAEREKISQNELHHVYTFNSNRKSMSTVVRTAFGFR